MTAQGKLIAALPDWVPKEAFEGWLEMRKAKKVPNTERAIMLALRKLDGYRQQGMDVEKIIDQSTEVGWTTFWPVKDDRGRAASAEEANFKVGRRWADGDKR